MRYFNKFYGWEFSLIPPLTLPILKKSLSRFLKTYSSDVNMMILLLGKCIPISWIMHKITKRSSLESSQGSFYLPVLPSPPTNPVSSFVIIAEADTYMKSCLSYSQVIMKPMWSLHVLFLTKNKQNNVNNVSEIVVMRYFSWLQKENGIAVGIK